MLEHNKQEFERYKQENWLYRRQLEQITEENIHEWRSNDLYTKSMSASSLRHALSSSSSFSKSMLEYEKLERSALKQGRIGRFSEYSSYQVCML